MSKIKKKNIFINIVISFWLRLMPFKYPFSVKIELTLKCFIFLLSQLSLFLYLLFIYKLIIFYFILIVSGLKLKPFSFVLSHFFLFYLQVVCVILLYLVLFCFPIWECLGPEIIRNTYCIPTILVCAGLWKRVKKRDSTKERDCMGGGGEAVSTGLVAWLVAPFSPTIHPYCSQSYLGVVADDK